MMLVLFVFGICFYDKGFLVFWWLVFDMNLLVVVGLLVVYFYLLVVIFVLGFLFVGMVNVYYEVVVVIVILILFGWLFEVCVKGCILEVIKWLVGF